MDYFAPEFFEGRVAEWYEHESSRWHGGHRIPLLTYLGMTADEYADWVLAGVIAPRVLRVWARL